MNFIFRSREETENQQERWRFCAGAEKKILRTLNPCGAQTGQGFHLDEEKVTSGDFPQGGEMRRNLKVENPIMEIHHFSLV